MKRRVCLIGLSVLLGADLLAQPVFRGSEIFPPEEFAARRARVDGRRSVTASPSCSARRSLPARCRFARTASSSISTGVAEPRASVIIDGRTRKTTVFLQPRTDKQDTSRDGPGLGPGPETAAGDRRGRRAAARRLHRRGHGDRGRPSHDLHAVCGRSAGQPVAGRPDTPVGGQRAGSVGRPRLARGDVHRASSRRPRRSRRSRISIRSLNALRAVKSPREIAVIREATRIAGLGIMEAMRDARPGMREYELQADAEFVFKKHGALGRVRTSR